MDQLQYMSFTDERGETVHFRLMDRIQPRWERFATALKFPQYSIENMQKKDPVFHLFSEWLQGTNQDHNTRPLTWRTLITALREANIQEEANILEKYLIVTESVQKIEPFQETKPAQETGSAQETNPAQETEPAWETEPTEKKQSVQETKSQSGQYNCIL